MIIVKIGGGARIDLEAVVCDLASMTEPYIIVHGANALRDQLAERLGVERKVLTSVSGFDAVYSDAEAIELLMMAYAGLANKRLVALCQRHGINAVGLSGIDGRAIVAKRNAGIRVRKEGKNLMVHDFSGKPCSINRALLELLLRNGYVPILSVPLIDESSTAVNSENDDIVTLLQSSFQAETVIQLIEAPGLLANQEAPDSVVAKLGRVEIAQALAQESGRMKRKLLAISHLLDNGVGRIIIADGRIKNPISRALAGEGTVIA